MALCLLLPAKATALLAPSTRLDWGKKKQNMAVSEGGANTWLGRYVGKSVISLLEALTKERKKRNE